MDSSASQRQSAMTRRGPSEFLVATLPLAAIELRPLRVDSPRRQGSAICRQAWLRFFATLGPLNLVLFSPAKSSQI